MTACDEAQVRIVHGTFVLVASRLLKLLAGWAVELALVRTLAPAVWDDVSRLLTFSLGVISLGQFGFPESVLNFASRADHSAEGKAVLHRAVGALVILAGFCCMGVLPFPAFRAATIGSSDLNVLLWFYIFVAAELAAALIPSFLIARRFTRQAGAYGVVARIPSILGALVALVIQPTLDSIVVGLALGSLTSALLGLIYVRVLVPETRPVRHDLGFRAQVSFAAPVGLSRFAQIVNAQLDKYVVMGFLPSAPFGTYYVGAVEFPLVGALGQTATSVMVPDLAQAAKDDLRAFVRMFHAVTAKLCLITLPVFVFLEVFAPKIFRVAYGSEYVDAATPFRIFQLLLLMRFTSYALVLQTLGRPRVPLYAAMIAVALNVPLNIVLTRAFGLIGPALSAVCSNYLSTIYTYWQLKRSMRVSLRQVLPWREYFLTLCLAVLCVVPAFLVARGGETLVWLVLGALVYVGTYLPAIRAFGLFTQRDARVLRHAVWGE